jgi:hypothetical protein
MKTDRQQLWILVIVTALGTAILSHLAARIVDPVVDRWFDRPKPNGEQY